MVNYRRYGQYEFAVSEKQVSASRAKWLCDLNDYKLANLNKSNDFKRASMFIRNEWPDKTNDYWRFNSDTDGKLSYAVFQPSTGLHFDDSEKESNNFVFMDPWWYESNDKEKFLYKNPKYLSPSEIVTPSDVSDEKGDVGLQLETIFSKGDNYPDYPKIDSIYPDYPEVKNNQKGIPKFNTASDVSIEEVDALPTGNGFSLSDLFSKGDFSLFVLLIIVASLFVVSVVLAIALSCVCKKYRKAKANNTTDASETV